jgi:hypothetical protein
MSGGDTVSNDRDATSRRSHDRATTDRTLGRTTAGGLALWGLTVWVVVAVSARLVGHVLLSPATPWLVAAVFAAAVPLMAAVTYPVYWRVEIPHSLRGSAAALMAVPGLFLDVLLLVFAEHALPSMGQATVVNFGALLLFGYAIVLATGIVPGRRAAA